MADAIHVAHLGVDAARTVLPTQFNWWMFVVALMLMSAPVAQMTRRVRRVATVDRIGALR